MVQSLKADGRRLTTPVTRPLTPAEVADDDASATGRAIGERLADLDPGGVPGVPAACHGRFAGGADVADSMRHAAPLAAVSPALPAPSVNLCR